MNQAELFGLAYFGGIALFTGVLVVLAQALFFDLSSRISRWVLPMVPVFAWTAMTLTIALSKRSLNTLLPDANAVGDGGSAWINRLTNAGLLALAFAKIVEVLYSRTIPQSQMAPQTAEQRANRNLFLAFVAYFICSVLMPMAFAEKPGFNHNGLPALVMFVTVYLARRETLERVIAGAKWILVLIMLASLAAGVLFPGVAVETNYQTGWIPGLHVRLWGLAAHANALSALGIYLALLLALQPARSKFVNMLLWLTTIVVIILAQSKTTWLAGILVAILLWGYRSGRDARGRIRPGFLTTLILGMAVVVSSLLFIDAGHVITKFMESDTGNSLSTLTGRTRIWAAAIDLWQKYPAFGYGLDTWAPEHRIQLGLPFATHAHNQLLQSLSVGGAFDAVAMLVYFFLLAGGAFRAAPRTRGVSLAMMFVIAFRCLSEAPLDLGNLASGEAIAQLLLFMLIVNEPTPEVADSPVAAPRSDRHLPRARAGGAALAR